VAKAPAREIHSLQGNVPVRITHQLFQHSQAPVIRTLIRWYDRPQQPLALEAFINIDDQQQRADFLDLAQRPEFRFLFYDQNIRHRLSKLVRNPDPASITQIATTAAQLRAAIPDEQFNFDAAKAAIMEQTSL